MTAGLLLLMGSTAFAETAVKVPQKDKSMRLYTTVDGYGGWSYF